MGITTMDIEVPEGRATKTVYLVRYDEELWMRWTEEQQQFCKDTWIKKAEPCEVEEVVLQLFPDELLPQYGHEKPYIVWRHKFEEVAREKLTVLKPIIYLHLDNGEECTENVKAQARKLMSEYPKGTNFVVRQGIAIVYKGEVK